MSLWHHDRRCQVELWPYDCSSFASLDASVHLLRRRLERGTVLVHNDETSCTLDYMIAQLDPTFIGAAPERAISRLVGYSLFEGRPATTAGRWWNPVVFSNLRLAARQRGKEIDRPIFIVGMGRSGTTLLGRLFAVHPDVGFLNEPKALWHVVREDEDIIGSYAPPRTGRLYLDVEDASDVVRQRAQAMFTWYLRVSHSKRVVDKYPELIFRHKFVRAIFPDARFLIAVREPWATLKSVTQWSSVNASDDADWWGVRDQKWDILWAQGVVQRPSNSDIATLDLASESDHRVRAAVEWIVVMREAVSIAAVPWARVVNYDEIVRHPKEFMTKTLEFCELRESKRTEGYADATVTSVRNQGERSTDSLRLPGRLTDIIDETWSQLVSCVSR